MDQRLSRLRDVAIGQDSSVTQSSPLSLAHFECLMDVLSTLHRECSAGSLSREKNVAKFTQKFDKTVNEVQSLRVNINDFEKTCTIGRGHYGEVQVVREKSSGETFAMKVMRKADILKNPEVVSVMEERDIMTWTRSPWLTSMKYSFQDTQHLYIVMDFYPGGDLFSIIEKEEALDEAAIRFYLAEIASGLNDLHRLGFVHRDVKPENVLIARSGHVKLVDFGVAARVENGKVVGSQLPVGTPSYLAPEVLRSLESSDGYGVECDWWSLGIIAYELMVGVTPFEGDTQKETYDNIMNYQESLQFSDEEGFEVSDEFQDLIRKLCINSSCRLGFEEIKRHEFFAGIDWDHLLDATPPYVPKLSGPDDTSHFEGVKSQGLTQLPFRSSRQSYGFNGQSLYFVGFTHSKFPALVPPDTSATVVTVNEVGVADVEDMKKELQLSEEGRRKLEKECAIYQSQLEDLHRQLEMEKLDRRSTDAKTLQLLSEVKEQGQIVQEMKEAEAKNKVEDLHTVVEQMEQDQALLGKKVNRLQDSLKSYKREAEQSRGKSSELEKKLTKLKGSHQKEMSSLQSKLMKVTKDSQVTIIELRKKLTKAEDELVEANHSVRQLRVENTSLTRRINDSKDTSGDASLYRDSSQVAIEGIKMAEMELRLESQKDDLETAHEELKNKHEELQNLKNQLHEMVEQVHSLTDEKHKLESDKWNSQQQCKDLVKELEETTTNTVAVTAECKEEKAKSKELIDKLEKSNKVLHDLQHSHDLLQRKVVEFEKHMTQSSNQQDLVRAVEKRNVSLEGEYKQLSSHIADLNRELENKKKEMVQLREDLWKEKAEMIKEKDIQDNKLKELQHRLKQTDGDLTRSRSTALELKRSNRELEKKLETAKEELMKKSERLSSLNMNLEALSQAKTELLSVMEKKQELENGNKALTDEVQQLKNNVEMDRQEYSRLYDLSEELKSQLEAEKLTSSLLQQKVDDLEPDLEALKSSEQLHNQQEISWSKLRQNLENDLDAAEILLDKAKVQLEGEQRLRQQAEAKVKQMTSHHHTTESVSQQELMEWKNKYEQSKEKAKEYSELLLEVKQRNAVLEVEVKELAHQLDIEKQLSNKLHDQFYSEHREHNILKAVHMKLVEKSKQDGIAQELLAKERGQQLSRLKEQATEQTKMQVTIAQQSKLIGFLQDKTPNKPKSKLRKGLKGIIKRSRDPAKEMEDWTKFKGFLAKKSSGSSPTGSANLSIGKSPSISSVVNGDHQHHMISATSLEHLTLSPSTDSFRSTRSASAAAARGTTPLREVSLRQCQVILPRSSSSFIMETSPTADLGRLSVTSPKRKIPSSSSSTIMAIEHNIPHKFSGASISVRGANCAACKTTIKRGHKSVKCKYCKVVCHPKCAADMPNTCGLPAELADHMMPPSSKRQKLDSQTKVEDEHVQLRKEGWLHVYHEGKSTGGQEWVVITDHSVCFYSRKDFSRGPTRKTVKAVLPLHNPSIVTIIHSTVKGDEWLQFANAKQSLAFAIEQYREEGDVMTYLVADTIDNKMEWLKVLDSILQEKSDRKRSSKNLKEVSVVPIDIATPLLRSKCISSSQFSKFSITSSLSDDTHQETTD